MKAKLPQPVHQSFLKHRKDFAWKILFPVILSTVLCIGLIVLINIATFGGGGDAARWAAISTMWIAVPTMIGMLIVLALIAGIIYLLAKLLNILPRYTSMVQDFFYKIESYAKRGADAAAKPVISISAVAASISRLFGGR